MACGCLVAIAATIWGVCRKTDTQGQSGVVHAGRSAVVERSPSGKEARASGGKRDQRVDPALLAGETIQFWNSNRNRPEAGSATFIRGKELSRRIQSLERPAIRNLVIEIQQSPLLDESRRTEVLSEVILMLLEKDPQTAMAMAMEFPGLFKGKFDWDSIE